MTTTVALFACLWPLLMMSGLLLTSDVEAKNAATLRAAVIVERSVRFKATSWLLVVRGLSCFWQTGHGFRI